MKKTFLSLFLLFIAINLCAQKNKEGKKSKEKASVLYYDLMELESGGVFRGINFDWSKRKVLAVEEARSTTSVYKDEEPGELIITTDMGVEILNFADVSYFFDEQGLYYIDVETYCTTQKANKKIYKLIVAHYTKQFGKGELAEDGYLEFHASVNGLDYLVGVMIYDDEESPGIYMLFSL